jgi:hydrogenase/urease accessory protein HupE
MKSQLIKRICIWLVPSLLLFFAVSVQAHEIRPAYLKITEVEAGVFDVFWKAPVRGTMRLKIDPVLPEHFENVTPQQVQVMTEAILKTWQIRSNTGTLEGETIIIDGLDTTITDALVNILFLDGRSFSKIVKPAEPSYTVPAKATTAKVAWTYLVLGVEHILGGIDHLLFVLALLLLVNNMWLLVKTITAFTVAHSITLAAAVLGYVSIPIAPVEAVIALSILFLAAELAHRQQGKTGLTERYPWLVSFTFGLLHGFGFASALSNIGLPLNQIPLALFQFNVGVEIGQLMFVAAALSVIWVMRHLKVEFPAWAKQIPNYAIGSVAAYWCIQRIMSFWVV